MNPFDPQEVRHVIFEMLCDFFFDTRKLNSQNCTVDQFEQFTVDWINQHFPNAEAFYDDYIKNKK